METTERGATTQPVDRDPAQLLEDKQAPVDAGLLDVIRGRWSPRAFADLDVEPATLRRILEAARWAMSSFNEQPWRYLVATRQDPDEHARLLSHFTESNRRWAQHAPVIMVSVVKTFFDKNGKPNRVAQHDVGAASAFLTLQALQEGLYVHQIAGVDTAALAEDFALPPGHEVVAGLAIGYLGDLRDLAEDLREREQKPRRREPIPSFVFTGAWGRPATWAADEKV